MFFLIFIQYLTNIWLIFVQYLSNIGQNVPNIWPTFARYLAQFFNATGHGPQTGRCVPNDKSDRYGNITVCEIQSWYDHHFAHYDDDEDDVDDDDDDDVRCPVEDDRLLLGKVRPLITGSENHTAFIKVCNKIRFTLFVVWCLLIFH